MVFVRTIAEILFFIANSIISVISLSSMSGEIFNKRGMLVFLFFLILLRESKSALNLFPS